MPALRSEHCVATISLATFGLVFCWALLLWAAGRGLDLTDDAHYLIWAADPFRYDWSVYEFGYLVHPLYLALGGDIAALRIAGAVILNLCALVFALTIWPLLAERAPAGAKAAVLLAIMAASLW